MRDNPELAAKLENQIRMKAGVVADAMLAGPDADEAADAALDVMDDDTPAPSKSKKSA